MIDFCLDDGLETGGNRLRSVTSAAQPLARPSHPVFEASVGVGVGFGVKRISLQMCSWCHLEKVKRGLSHSVFLYEQKCCGCWAALSGCSVVLWWCLYILAFS